MNNKKIIINTALFALYSIVIIGMALNVMVILNDGMAISLVNQNPILLGVGSKIATSLVTIMLWLSVSSQTPLFKLLFISK